MSLKIQDGTGQGYVARVTDRNQLKAYATSSSISHIIAEEDAQVYFWTSSYSASSGDEIIYIKNTSKDKLLMIDQIIVGGVVTSLFEMFEVSGTAGGTVITGVNSNLSSGNVADAAAYGNASVTGLTIGNRLHIARVPAK
jgi:hypothetical protein